MCGQPRTLSGSGGDSIKVKELETQLLETRMLYTTTLDDYNLVSWTTELATNFYLFVCGRSSARCKCSGLRNTM